MKNSYGYSKPKSDKEEIGFFFIAGRITAATFYKRVFLSICIFLLSYGVYNYFNDTAYVFLASIHLYIIPFVLLLFILIQGAKRMHDINKSGWYFLIPVYNIYFSFCKGDVGSNNFGIDPKSELDVNHLH